MQHRILEWHQPADEMEKELLPTFEGLVSASFHDLHGSYWKNFLLGTKYDNGKKKDNCHADKHFEIFKFRKRIKEEPENSIFTILDMPFCNNIHITMDKHWIKHSKQLMLQNSKESTLSK